MKLFLIKLNKVSWDDDRALVVSGVNSQEALSTARFYNNFEIAKNNYSNRSMDNIESIDCIGTYFKEVSEVVIIDNNQG